MGKAFWTAGPVPPALLAEMALPRPAAQATVLARLAEGRTVRVAGPPGWGKTTFLLQVVAAAQRPALLIDLQALLQGTEEEALASAAPQVGLRLAPDWATALAALAPDAILALDGGSQPEPAWVRAIPGPVLVTADLPGGMGGLGGAGAAGGLGARGDPSPAAGPGAVIPDSISPSAASAFLERRAARLRLTWTPAALREAVALAAGHPARLQAVGAACAHGALEQSRRRITMDDYLEAAIEVAQGRPGHGPLAELDGPRLALLKAVVRHPEGRPTEWAERCGLEARAAIVHLGRLAAHGWLARPARGQYAIADPAVALHLQARFSTVARVVRPAGAARGP